MPRLSKLGHTRVPGDKEAEEKLLQKVEYRSNWHATSWLKKETQRVIGLSHMVALSNTRQSCASVATPSFFGRQEQIGAKARLS
jgi:hypothetical protein